MTGSEDFFKLVEKTVRGRYAEGNTGQESPKLFVYRLSVEQVVMTQLPSEVSRGAPLNGVIATLLEVPDCAAVGFVTEAWVAKGLAGAEAHAKGLMPSETPGRTEAIIATYYARGCTPVLMSIEIMDEGGKRTLAPERVIMGREKGEHLDGALVRGLGTKSH